MAQKIDQKATTPQIKNLINQLQQALYEEYGCDYSYTIMAKGFKVAASNMVDGEIKAIANEPT